MSASSMAASELMAPIVSPYYLAASEQVALYFWDIVIGIESALHIAVRSKLERTLICMTVVNINVYTSPVSGDSK